MSYAFVEELRQKVKKRREIFDVLGGLDRHSENEEGELQKSIVDAFDKVIEIDKEISELEFKCEIFEDDRLRRYYLNLQEVIIQLTIYIKFAKHQILQSKIPKISSSPIALFILLLEHINKCLQYVVSYILGLNPFESKKHLLNALKMQDWEMAEYILRYIEKKNWISAENNQYAKELIDALRNKDYNEVRDILRTQTFFTEAELEFSEGESKASTRG